MPCAGAIAQWAVIQHAILKTETCELTAMTAALLTLGKTALYAFVEIASGSRHTAHNNLQDLVLLYIIPNGLWLLFPAAIVLSMRHRILARYGHAKTQ